MKLLIQDIVIDYTFCLQLGNWDKIKNRMVSNNKYFMHSHHLQVQ